MHAIDHPAGLNENNVSFTIGYTTTDHDGDTATGSLAINVNDDTPTISNIQDAIMPNVSNTDVHGTWQPSFGADGPSSLASAISLAMGTAPSGTTYTFTSHGTNAGGDAVTQVDVKSGTTLLYTFYEYTHYDPATHTSEMFAYTNLADAQGATGANEFFTLTVATDGTYDFHLVTNSLQSTNTFDITGVHPGNGNYATIINNVGDFGNGAVPSSGYDVLIDGINASNVNDNVYMNNNGLGVGNGNLDTNETLTFKFALLQSQVSMAIGKSLNSVTEHFEVTIWNADHSAHATWDVTQADGTPLVIDAAHWGTGGSATGAFFDFAEVDVKNIASVSGDDSKLVILSLTYNSQTVVSDTSLNFSLGITDHDGDTYTSSDNLSVTLQGTHTAPGYQLSGTNDVFAASANGHDTFTGNGTNDTVDFSNAASSVQVYLDGSHSNAGAAFGDTLTGIENLIGSSHDDLLVGDANSNILTGGGGTNTMTGGAGADTFKIDHLDIKDIITDFHGAGPGGEGDQIDLTALFDKADNVALSNYVQYNSANGTLSVDSTGTGSNFVVVAELQTPPPAANTINILYDDSNHHQQHVTI
ncbi:hypothetical protein MPLDJ20_60001 [Mesorhizobium plurifarium]|uniref:Type I secretion C-terminal target domain-containing protein n=1 Tax=Mesorhizobium plurifarium TaxID=69974 RepID=A0A090FM85_MESPL|nr:hypothetical protein MPLDJ20_60001 [Mesorhizobium plurifarium]